MMKRQQILLQLDTQIKQKIQKSESKEDHLVYIATYKQWLDQKLQLLTILIPMKMPNYWLGMIVDYN